MSKEGLRSTVNGERRVELSISMTTVKIQLPRKKIIPDFKNRALLNTKPLAINSLRIDNLSLSLMDLKLVASV